MRRYGRRGAALAVVSCGMMTAGTAAGGSAWFALDPDQTVCDVYGTGACSIELSWMVGNEDKFDKWKLYWKVKEGATWLDDHCEYHAKIRKLENNFYAIPGLDMDLEYRVKLEGRRERNENWTCIAKTMIRNIGHSAWLDNGGLCTDF